MISPGRSCQTHGPSIDQPRREYHACLSSVNKYRVWIARNRASSSTAPQSAAPNTLTPKLWADKYSAEPRRQIFASLQIVHAQGGGPEKLSIRMRHPCNRQLIPIQVRPEFFDPSLRSFFAQNSVPLFEQPLGQLRDVFGMLNQVANLNCVHTNPPLRGGSSKSQAPNPKQAPNSKVAKWDTYLSSFEIWCLEFLEFWGLGFPPRSGGGPRPAD
jgi:hypothetical protein